MKAERSVQAAQADHTIGVAPLPAWEASLASPVRTLIYLWCGAFWTWVVAQCLIDCYPVLGELLRSMTGLLGRLSV